ncbi:head-tail adaptor protein [Falsirhodobacter halotolerans]|uniref:head-tail adaptor protein n=1 Tax=Falsirhodobacter halotolerans TaxID=1146892 RepID=UPI001FD08FCB|nr:head-tail adaptor protein [Falsirhodobacter halotolerans]MCJ8139299.1 head-tail adaptor protein [Falsirhodobacter halotolerans]
MRLSRVLELQEESRESDGAGGVRTGWRTLGRVWADVRAGSAREVAGVETVAPAVSLKITVRAAPFGAPSRPVAGQRFREGERVFSILAVTERDARYLTCYAEERA